MSLLKWHVCVCSVLLCISVRSAAATQLHNPASQSISQVASLALTAHLFLSLMLSSSASLPLSISCLLHKAISFSRLP